MADFNLVWENLQTHLKPGTKIKIWNPYNGYLGEHLTIIDCDLGSIAIDPPRVWDSQAISKTDFYQVWDIWGEYLALRLQRSQLRALSEHHKYIVSIFHWYESEVRSNKLKDTP